MEGFKGSSARHPGSRNSMCDVYNYECLKFRQLCKPSSQNFRILLTIGASSKWVDFKHFSHLTLKMGLILAVLPHFTIAPALAKKQIHSNWAAENAFPQNLAFKWEKSLKKLAPKVTMVNHNCTPDPTSYRPDET